ncbi:SH3 domain-containing protein [Candidatus Latescibacterota bacterium]
MTIKHSISMCILSIVLLLPAYTTVAQDDPVRAPLVLPGTTGEMNDPEFWINRIDDPDRIIIPEVSIPFFNREIALRAIGDDHPYAKNIARIEKDGSVFNRLNPLGVGPVYPTGSIRSRLNENISRLEKKTYYDRWALPLTDEKKSAIVEELNLDALPSTQTPKKALVIGHTSVRLYPTDEPGYLMKIYLDDFNVTSIDIGMAAAVLHESKSGAFLFVMTPVAWGWVRSVDVAYAPEADIRTYQNMDRFITVTGHKIPLYAESGFATHSGYLYMGERLPIRGESADGYRVNVPVRRFDGSLAYEEGHLRKSDMVHDGWLPFTKRNAVTVAFRLLGRQYGWHDSWDERDCGGIMRVIFGCFGMELPRYWSYQQACLKHAAFVGDIKDIDEKNRQLADMPAGITFTGTTGHIGLYLGSVDGKPYVLHECGWNYKRDGKEYKMARVVVSDYENVGFNMDKIQFFSPITP